MTTEAKTGRQSLTGDCASAFLLLSRIPVTWHRFRDDQPPDFISSLWAFPLVGLVIGAAGGGVLAAGQALALPTFAIAILSLTTMIFLSGAMHEDGLADMADASAADAIPKPKSASCMTVASAPMVCWD